MRVSDLVLVDHSGMVIEGKRIVNRAVFIIHAQVHQAREDVVAAHTHSLGGQAFSSLGLRLDPITQDACAFFEDHGIHSDRACRSRWISGLLAGWFPFRLWEQITQADLDLFD